MHTVFSINMRNLLFSFQFLLYLEIIANKDNVLFAANFQLLIPTFVCTICLLLQKGLSFESVKFI